MIWLYRLLWIVLLPVMALWLVVRLIQGKEDRQRLKERLGWGRHPRPNGQLIWLHAASVGEAISILPLVKKLLATHDGLNILITTGTRTSADLLAARLPQMDEDRLFHQYVPLDFFPCVTLFLRHWRPNVSAFVESEFWPDLLTQASQPILLNGRLSNRSFPRYKRYGFLFRPLIQRFAACLAQSEQDKERLEALGAQNVLAAGNLKFDAAPLQAHEREQRRMASALKGRKVLIYASTHKGEEQLFSELHAKLKKHDSSLLTIIVPRHPERGQEILKQLEKQGYKTPKRSAGHVAPTTENVVMLRSQGLVPNEGCEIYVADTLGELGLWYSLAHTVVMGGSFVDLGKVSGHNPVEPLRLLAPTLVGPHMNNFSEMMDILQRHNILPQVTDIKALEKKLTTWLTDDIQTEKRRKDAIKAAMTDLSGSADAAVEALKELLG